GLSHSASDPTVVHTPTLSIAKSHSGNFAVGQAGSYTITVSNPGTIATGGTVTVNDSLPSGLSPTAMSGTGWNCFAQPGFLNCSRSDSLAGGASYPDITLSVAVASNVSSAVTNQASVSGGGDSNNHTATDPTNINLPDLAIVESHIGDFTVGQPGSYTITIT